jgi:glutamyl-tRNA reductase
MLLSASKKIKTDTEISSGATGFFAAVRYIINNVQDIGNKNILLFGTEKLVEIRAKT